GRADVFALKLVAVLREIQRHFLDVTRVNLSGEFAIAGRVFARGLALGGNQAPEHDSQKYDRNPEQNCLSRGTRIHIALAIKPEPINRKKFAAPLALFAGLLLQPLAPRRATTRHQVLAVAARAVGGGQAVAGPQLVRCSLEAKVIGLQVHMASGRLVQQHGQPQRTRLALANAPQQKILRNPAFNHRIHQQDIAALELRAILAGGHGVAIGEKDFAARLATQVNVANILANEVHDHGHVNGANQIGGKDERAVHGHHDVNPAAVAATGNLPAQGLHATRDACGSVSGDACLGHDAWSSTITTPARVSLPAANSWAAPNPRTHAICPPVVSTGQTFFAQRLTPISFNRRANLWRF